VCSPLLHVSCRIWVFVVNFAGLYPSVGVCCCKLLGFINLKSGSYASYSNCSPNMLIQNTPKTSSEITALLSHIPSSWCFRRPASLRSHHRPRLASAGCSAHTNTSPVRLPYPAVICSSPGDMYLAELTDNLW
jgi:hypothetical protein